METAIGVFASRERAEEALKELLNQHVPQESITYLTRSESEASSLAKELGSYAGGFVGGAAGLSAGVAAASIFLIPGLGQVIALGAGATALLGFLGARAGSKAGEAISQDEAAPHPTSAAASGEDTALFLQPLKQGRSLRRGPNRFRRGRRQGMFHARSPGHEHGCAACRQDASCHSRDGRNHHRRYQRADHTR